jgi:transposase-like protein
MADSRRRFSREFKVEAVRQVLDGGRPLARVARELCTKTGWVCVWVIGELLAASFFPRPSRGARDAARRVCPRPGQFSKKLLRIRTQSYI